MALEEEPQFTGITCGYPSIQDADMLWQLESIDQETSNLANRIASLFPTLVNFYLFLQDWGMVDVPSKDDPSIQVKEYNMGTAQFQERDLEVNI